ncbi:MAG: lipoprotein [Spiroplasma phoeniceum]|nr:MAG: lipoprotein [Spiroplasma phoeniceum]UZQ32715.1 MAG: lipoprotein [Spiroplasma phoeniceum]
MKKILSLLGIINLVVTITTNLVACNTPQQYTKEQLKELKNKNNIKTKDGILEWISPQEAPFKNIDDDYYFVVWRGNKNLEWRIAKFKNTKKIRLGGGFKLVLDYYGRVDDPNKINLVFDAKINNLIANDKIWTGDNINFKSVYHSNFDISQHDLIIDNYDNIKIK